MSTYELIAACWVTAGDAPAGAENDRSPLGVRERIEAAGRAGFKGFGIGHLDLLDAERTVGFPDLKRMLADNGIEHFEIEFLMNWFTTGEDRERSDKIRADMLRAAEAVGARHIKCGDHTGAKISVDRLAESFAGLAADAAEAGTRLALEPMPFGAIKTPQEGLEVVQRAGHPAGGLLIDIWHTQRAGVDFATLADFPAEHLTSIELDDAPATWEGDLLADTFNGRRLCGEGEFDVAGFVDAIKSTGYQGPWGVEILGAEYRKLPLEEAVNAAYTTTLSFLDRPAG
ncbi:sugar phosphate isomerase/epimerase family protein [Streptomyces africanus]|uniref:sugar phosphate isomerase/epimerase family protein n=1 Tax=Streptomyces africanus TaxID=231024 RepID=UPI000A3D551A|nr:sugar phosphate isomerase/epimerase [Streptomyces africanus]